MSPPADPAAPGVARRIAALLYEALLLLALLLIASFPVAGLKGATLEGWPRFSFQLYLGAVVAAYFTWFWRHGGQTLPMKTWRIRLVGAGGAGLSPARALLRLAVAALFYGPACAGTVLLFFPQRLSPSLTAWLFVPMAASWLWARFDGEQQFLHDRLAGTRQLSAAPAGERAPRTP